MIDFHKKVSKTTLEKPKKKSFLWRVFFFFSKMILLIVLPFIVLIRGAVFLNVDYSFGAWTALFISLFICSAVCLVYLFLIYKFLFPKPIGWKGIKKLWIISLLSLSCYCAYSVWYFSDDNAKTQHVASEYHSLHPLLRMGIATLLFLDNDAIMTDFSRTHADYKAMGKRSLINSLHYVQKDSYVHAVDIRTIGRGEIRNNMLRVYFYLMGFQSLRHHGTADHLHISLPIKPQ